MWLMGSEQGRMRQEEVEALMVKSNARGMVRQVPAMGEYEVGRDGQVLGYVVKVAISWVWVQSVIDRHRPLCRQAQDGEPSGCLGLRKAMGFVRVGLSFQQVYRVEGGRWRSRERRVVQGNRWRTDGLGILARAAIRTSLNMIRNSLPTPPLLIVFSFWNIKSSLDA